MTRTRERILMTGDPNLRSPLEKVEDNSDLTLEDESVYCSDRTDLYVFEIDNDKTVGFSFYFENTGKVSKYGAGRHSKFEKHLEILEKHGANYDHCDVPWGTGTPFSRIANNILEASEDSRHDPNDYMEDLRNFYDEVLSER